MRADRKWVERNLGCDPIATPPPGNTFAFAPAATTSKPEDFQREIIDFDSESPVGREFLAFSTATGLSRYVDVPWPKGLAPKPATSLKRTSSDPQTPFSMTKGGYVILKKDGQVTQEFGSKAKEKRFATEDRRGHRSEYRKSNGLRF